MSQPDALNANDAAHLPEGRAGDQRTAEVQARFVAAIEQTPIVAVQGFDRNGMIQVWNGASEKLYGITRAQAIGKSFQELLNLENVQCDFATELARIWDSGQPSLPQDWKIETASGKVIWVYSAMFPVMQDGCTQLIFCMDIDITVRKESEQRLIDSETKFRSFFERSADAIILLRDNQFFDFNPAALALFGYTADHGGMSGLQPVNVSPVHQPCGRRSDEKMAEMTALALEKGNHCFEWQYCDRNKRAFWGEVALTTIQNDGEKLVYALVRDITERKNAEQALRLAAQVFESSREAILITDSEKRIISVNPSFTAITGYSQQQSLGNQPRLLGFGLYKPEFYEKLSAELDAAGHWEGEMWARRSDGRSFPAWISITAVRGNDGRISNYIGIFSDITERKETERHIRHMIEHDFLTGLPNRVLLLDRLQQAIANARRNRNKLAVLFLDLDRFKNVNDSLGHHIGDKLLQVVAERLQRCVRGNDTVSRQGGDEFVVMLDNVRGVEQVAHIAADILGTIGMPYQIDEHAINISTCIGIGVYPDDGQDIDTLLKNADTAMYHAKESGRNSYQFFNPDMNARIVERITLENHLRSALENDQFFLQYQPEVDIETGRTIGVEALIRWQHPDGGVTLPERFLSVAEECGLIVPIGEWVLRTACRQARAWFDQGMPVVIGVNLSATQFRQKNFLQSVRDALAASNLPPDYLELEITENILVDNTMNTIETMHALREMGVRLAIDDFGTGYSSLSYLKYFPVDKLKIDQSFVHDLRDDANDAAIIRAILIMAKSLKLKVIAEGVETDDQLAFLRSQGCDEYQGRHLAAPMREAEMMPFLHRH